MIDKTMLELVDRLVATTNRATKAEYEANLWRSNCDATEINLNLAKDEIDKLKAEIQSLKNDIEIKDDTICRQYAAKEKLKERIKELEQNDTEGS